MHPDHLMLHRMEMRARAIERTHAHHEPPREPRRLRVWAGDRLVAAGERLRGRPVPEPFVGPVRHA